MILQHNNNGSKPLSERIRETASRIAGDAPRVSPDDQTRALIARLTDFSSATRDDLLVAGVIREVARLTRLDAYELTKRVLRSKPSTKPSSHIEGVCEEGSRQRIYPLRELKNIRERRGETAEESLPLFGVTGIIRRGRTHLLSAKPRTGKTELLFRGGVMCWHGERILYLSEENESDWDARLATYAESALPDNATVWLATGAPREGILAEIQNGGYTVVITDTLRTIWRLVDEINPSRVVEDLHPLITLQRRVGFTLINVHHERKSDSETLTDRAAGSNALSALHDMLLSLAQKGERQLCLSYEGRTSPGGSILLQWRDGELVYVGEERAVEFRTLAQRVEGILFGAGRALSTKELWNELGEPRPSLAHLHNVLSYLLSNGKVRREPKEERKGASYRWYAPNLQPSSQPTFICEEGCADPFAVPEGGLLAYDPVSGHWYPRHAGGAP